MKNGSSPILRARNVKHVILFDRLVQGGLLDIVRGPFWYIPQNGSFVTKLYFHVTNLPFPLVHLTIH